MPSFGQIVMGAAGAGKTTYCDGVSHYLELAGRRCVVVNLDPANARALPYAAALDVRDLIAAEEVAERYRLGPNGSLVFCMEYLERNVDWLIEKLQGVLDAGSASGGPGADQSQGTYILFDCPGQVEIFAQQTSFRNVIHTLAKRMDLRLAAVHLVDAQLW